MPSEITVDLAGRSYPIRIGRGLLGDPGVLAGPGLSGRFVFLVSDEQIAPRYAPRVRAALRQLSCRVSLATVPAGEDSKSHDQLLRLYHEAARARLDRGGWVLALGGGVVGDLGGFFAATWMRGVRLVQAPTTTLAMADSSVGGKTAVNLPEGKNLVGAFHQPSAVIADLDTLASLPPRELRAGLAEIVKTAAIADGSLFRELEKSAARLADPAAAEWEAVLARCCRIKAGVVGADEREAGGRAVLNFGHTAAHAFETLQGGNGALLHGEALAAGMLFAARVSERVLGFPGPETARIARLLDTAGLPVRPPALPWTAVRRAMELDKKSVGGSPRLVLLRRLGSAVAGCAVEERILKEAWHAGGE